MAIKISYRGISPYIAAIPDFLGELGCMNPCKNEKFRRFLMRDDNRNAIFF
jgi:hypothetical protein